MPGGRDRAAKLMGEYLRRFDASGVSYSFHAFVSGEESGFGPGNAKFLDIDRCDTGSGR
jgi:hypothetical protein